MGKLSRGTAGIASLMTLTAALAGCGSGGATVAGTPVAAAGSDTSLTRDASATSTAPSRPADSSTSRQIPFDPCRDIPVRDLRGAGLDPTTAEHSTTTSSRTSSLTCMLVNPPGEPAVLARFRSSDNPFDRELRIFEKEASRTDVNGRPAFFTASSNERNDHRCEFVLDVEFGVVTVMLSSFNIRGNSTTQRQVCADARRLAETIEPLIGG